VKRLATFLLLLLLPSIAGAVCTVPVITSPLAVATDTSGTAETVTWTTDVPADSNVSYGLGFIDTYPNGNSGADLGGVTTHTVLLTGLIPGTTYNASIRSRTISGGVPCDYHYYKFYGESIGGFSFTTVAAPAGTFDYVIAPIGPQYVTQGYGVYLTLRQRLLVGTYTIGSGLKIVLTGLPNFVSVTWSNSFLGGGDAQSATNGINYDTSTVYLLDDKEFYVLTNVGGATTPGAYTVTATVSKAGLPTHTATFPLTVDAAASPYGIAFPFGTPSSYPAVPDLATYKTIASTYGAINCAQDLDASPRTIRANNDANLGGIANEAQSYYYDGVRGYHNISDLLGDIPTWTQCRNNIKDFYRDDYIIDNGGVIAGWRVFPQGYYIDYIRTGDTADLTAIDMLDAKTYNPVHGNMVFMNLQRETAYALKVDTYENKLGRSQTRYTKNTVFWLSYYLEHVLGNVDRICRTQNAGYYETFMAGLEADALIDYYVDSSPDPRIPSAIKCLADFLITDAYNADPSDQGAFQYDKFRGYMGVTVFYGASSAIVLNQLITPMGAWLFKMTGLDSYRTTWDPIWDYGVLMTGGASQGGGPAANFTYPGNPSAGKQFMQQYYWGKSYVDWRSAPVVPGVAPATALIARAIQ
jgi:hypothetical protein